jgi:hypothetical protein
MPKFRGSSKKDDDGPSSRGGDDGSDDELDQYEQVVAWHEQRWEIALWCFEIMALAAAVGTAGFFVCLMLNFLAVLLLDKLHMGVPAAVITGLILLGMMLIAGLWTLRKFTKNTDL